MKKLFLVGLFAVFTINSYADIEWKWVRIFNRLFFYDFCQVFEYYDQTIVDLSGYQEYLQDSLNIGETYMLKASWGTHADSCLATYDYIPESYELDGFWTYANNGNLMSPDGYMGIYNIEETDYYCPEDYPDAEEDELIWHMLSAGTHFLLNNTGALIIRVEIYAWRAVIV